MQYQAHWVYVAPIVARTNSTTSLSRNTPVRGPALGDTTGALFIASWWLRGIQAPAKQPMSPADSISLPRLLRRQFRFSLTRTTTP
jgi:hypothetical protein